MQHLGIRGGIAAFVLAYLALLSACAAPQKSTIPPPKGKSYDEYLNGDKKPAKQPDELNERNTMRLHAIDIGQGSATLLEFPCGAVLVDTGGEKNKRFDSEHNLINYLDSFFARRKDLKNTIDLLVVTHPHIDHTRSIETVLAAYTVRNIVDNGTHRDDMGGRPQIAMHKWIEARRGNVGHRDIRQVDISPKTGMTDAVIDPIHGCGRSAIDPVLTVLWGAETEELASYGTNPNLHSVALRVDFGKSSVLITGDLEYAGISRMVAKYKANPKLLDVDVYVVGHHGSKNATTAYQMKAMTPKVAVVSMSPYERREMWTARRFGHPHVKAISHLVHHSYGVSARRKRPIDVMIGLKGAWKNEKREVFEKQRITKAVYATGWDGHIVIKMNASGWLDVATQKGN